MQDYLFVAGLAVVLGLVLNWAFRTLPRERWQILAAVPLRKDRQGWTGVNLTFYGFFVASANTLALATYLLLSGSLGFARWQIAAAMLLVLVCGLPAAKIVARIVEKKKHTLTVGGAIFVGMLASPFAVFAVNALSRRLDTPEMPVAPFLTSLTVAYILGEGFGRLACISFGCCYGKRLQDVGPFLQKLFRNRHFKFRGDTKKIAYASDWEGVEVVPIQAVTSCIYLATGLASILLFLKGRFTEAFLLSAGVSQFWRFYSETLRADHRGGGRITAYQWMGLATVAYGAGVLWLFPAPQAAPQLMAGLGFLWDVATLLVLQGFWLAIFLFTGVSMVTGSVLSFHVHEDRI